MTREEYLDISIKHCDEVIEQFKSELEGEKDIYVIGILKNFIADWEQNKLRYLNLKSSFLS